METLKKYENYPFWIVILSNLVSFFIYGLGFFIMHKTGMIFSMLYLAFILIMEFRLMRYHCINCYYWGKTCGFGKGKISSWFFTKGDMSKFCIKEMTWKDMIPDMLISLIPLITGIVILVIQFDYILLSALLLLILFTTTGNGIIRGKLTCRYCKQKELGCPAEKLFADKK